MRAYSSHGVQNAGPANNQTYTWSASHITVNTGRIAASLFIAECYEPYSEIDNFFSNLYNRNSHDPENDGHPKISETLRDDVGSSWRCHCRQSGVKQSRKKSSGDGENMVPGRENTEEADRAGTCPRPIIGVRERRVV